MRRALLALCAIVAALHLSEAKAASFFDQDTFVPKRSDTRFFGSGVSKNGPLDRRQVQTFKPGTTGYLQNVVAQTFGGSGTLRVSLYRGDLAAGSGTLIKSQDWQQSDPLPPNSSFVVGVYLDPDQVFARRDEVFSIELQVIGDRGSWGWIFGANDLDGNPVTAINYDRGYNSNSFDAGAPGTWTPTGNDRGFRDSMRANLNVANAIRPSRQTADGAKSFFFVPDDRERVFIDPVAANGYVYKLQEGGNILDVLLPSLSGDTDGYSIFALDGSLLGHAVGGSVFAFANGGVRGFQVRDIDGLAPGADFVSGLTFAGTDAISMTQGALAVPEPSLWVFLLAGFGAIGAAVRKRRLGSASTGIG